MPGSYLVWPAVSGPHSCARHTSLCRGGGKIRRVGFGAGPKRGGRRVQPRFRYFEDDIMDHDPDANWTALNVRHAKLCVPPATAPSLGARQTCGAACRLAASRAVEGTGSAAPPGRWP